MPNYLIMEMNYLALLKADVMDIIFTHITNDIAIAINKLEIKVHKLYVKLKPLKINYNISYDYTVYYMNKYLFDNFKGSNIFLLYFYNDECKTFISKKLNNPTYLDILIEANKSILCISNYHIHYLKGLRLISKDKVYNYIGILPNNNNKYYKLVLKT